MTVNGNEFARSLKKLLSFVGKKEYVSFDALKASNTVTITKTDIWYGHSLSMSVRTPLPAGGDAHTLMSRAVATKLANFAKGCEYLMVEIDKDCIGAGNNDKAMIFDAKDEELAEVTWPADKIGSFPFAPQAFVEEVESVLWAVEKNTGGEDLGFAERVLFDDGNLVGVNGHVMGVCESSSNHELVTALDGTSTREGNLRTLKRLASKRTGAGVATVYGGKDSHKYVVFNFDNVQYTMVSKIPSSAKPWRMALEDAKNYAVRAIVPLTDEAMAFVRHIEKMKTDTDRIVVAVHDRDIHFLAEDSFGAMYQQRLHIPTPCDGAFAFSVAARYLRRVGEVWPDVELAVCGPHKAIRAYSPTHPSWAGLVMPMVAHDDELRILQCLPDPERFVSEPEL